VASAETAWNSGMERATDEPPIVKIILIIEDDRVVASRLGEMFALKANDQVIVASTCKAAMKFMRSCTPNLILLSEHLLINHEIDLSQRLFMMVDLQAIPLLLHGSAFH
jgi:DNA-binding response OmpR family regulator